MNLKAFRRESHWIGLTDKTKEGNLYWITENHSLTPTGVLHRRLLKTLPTVKMAMRNQNYTVPHWKNRQVADGASRELPLQV